MSSVDDRIVNMQFNNKQFVQGAAESEKSLAGLEKTLARTGSSKGLTQLESSVNQITTRFSVMQVAGVTAIAKITSSAMDFGKNLIGRVMGPLTEGGMQRALNIEQAKFQFAGLGMDIEKSMASALEAVRGTAYGLDAAAKLASQFGASGMRAGDEMTNALKGVAGAAAMTNTSFEEIGHIFKSIAGEGKVSAVRMEQFGTRGLNAWAAVAKAMGKTEGEVRAMVKDRALDFRTFAAAMNDAFGEHATAANKTYTGSLSNLRAALSRIGASFAGAKIENHRRIFNSLTPVIDNVHSALEPLIKSYETWQKVVRRNLVRFLTPLGDPDNNPFTKFSETLGNVGQTLVALQKIVAMALSQIGSAFNEVFGGSSGGGFLKFFENVTAAVRDFFTTVKNNMRDGEGLKPFFVGFFSLLKIGVTLITGIAAAMGGFFKGLFSGVKASTGGFGDLVKSVSQVLKGFSDWLSEGDRVVNFMRSIGGIVGAALSPILSVISSVTNAISSAFSGGTSLSALAPSAEASSRIQSFGDKIDGVRTSIIDVVDTFNGGLSRGTERFAEAGDRAATRWNIIQGAITAFASGLSYLFQGVGKLIGWVWDRVSNLFSGMSAGNWAQLFESILMGGVLLAIKKFVDSLTEITSGLGAALNFQEVFDGLTGTLEAMQSAIKANVIKNIAIGVALLTASLIALTFIDPARLVTSLGAIGALMGMLVTSIGALTKVGGGLKKSNLLLLTFAGVMLTMSLAITQLAIATSILGQQDPIKVARGIAFLAASMGLMVGAVAVMSKIGPVLKRGAASMVIMAFALNLVASAVLAFGMMKPEDATQGLYVMAGAIAVLTGALAIFSQMNTAGLVKASVSLGILSGSILVLASAIAVFGRMKYESLIQGLLGMATSLAMLVGAMALLSVVGKTGAAGAASIAIIAGALGLLVPTILALGAAPWEVVARGLGFVAAGLAIFLIAAAAASLPPIAIGLAVLAATMGVLGGAMFLAGVGMTAFAAGISVLVAAGSAGVAVLKMAFEAFIAMLPNIATSLGAAFVSFLQAIAANTPKIRRAITSIITDMIRIVRDNIPKFRKLIEDFVGNALAVIVSAADDFAQAGFDVIRNFLTSAEREIPEITRLAFSLVTKFLDEIAAGLPDVISSAANVVLTFLEAIGNEINNEQNLERMRNAGKDIAYGIVNGLTGGLLGKGIEMVRSAVDKLVKVIPKPVRKFLGIASPSKMFHQFGLYITQGLANGINAGTKRAVNAAAKMANAVIAQGERSVLRVQQNAAKVQRAADRAEANANLAERRARRSQREANRLQREADKAADKNAKNQKKLQKQADEAQRRADAQASAADKKRDLADRKQVRADAAAQKVLWQKEFQQADNWRRGEMRDERAVQFAADAQAMLAKANANAAEIKRLSKSKNAADKKAAKALRKENQKVIKEARKLAQAAQNARNQAIQEYAKAITASVTSIRAEQEAYDKAQRDEAELEAAKKPDEKAAILERRSAANEKAAEDARKKGEAALKAAERLAKSDALAAAKQLEIAEEQLALSRELNDQAKSERTQAQQLRDQAKSQAGSEGANANITPSKAVLEEAAKTIDRYTESLRQAQEAAATAAPVVQFVQHNSSPEALTASEIYRQTKNLLSTQEIKMGAK